jgi:mono/diheme cytochrome c family protein
MRARAYCFDGNARKGTRLGRRPLHKDGEGKSFMWRNWLSGIVAVVLLVAADGGWLKHVPEADRKRVNPLAGQADAIAGGARIFDDHCAKCHGEDAMGHGKRPSLRSERVQQATDGEIFWLLKNGNLGKGMPTWAALPEPMRWQVIAYVKSLGPSSTGEANKSVDGAKP